MPRFYVHFAAAICDAAGCTLIVDLPYSATVAQLLAECCIRCEGTVIDPAALQVTIATDTDGGVLHPEETLAQHVKNGTDVLISLLDEGEVAALGALPGTQAAAVPDTASLQPGMLKYLQEVLEDSTKAVQAKNFRGACELHDKIFAIDPTNMQACYQQALVELSISAYSRACATLERALTAIPPPQEPEIYVKLGEAYDGKGGAENYQTALQHYDTALGLASASAAYDEDRIDNIKILMATTLQKAANEQVALQLVTSVLQRNEQHTEALVLYGAMMTERYATLR
jgi:tetratricopeptide (TPR) repeat protein